MCSFPSVLFCQRRVSSHGPVGAVAGCRPSGSLACVDLFIPPNSPDRGEDMGRWQQVARRRKAVQPACTAAPAAAAADPGRLLPGQLRRCGALALWTALVLGMLSGAGCGSGKATAASALNERPAPVAPIAAPEP